jgi:hypothetical protein
MGDSKAAGREAPGRTGRRGVSRLLSQTLEDAFDAPIEFVGRKRFEDIFFGAEFEAVFDLGFLTAGGEKDDGNVSRRRLSFEGLAGLVTGHFGHADVEEDEVRLFLRGFLDGVLTVECLDDVKAGKLQAKDDQATDVGLIFGYEYLFLWRHVVGILHPGSV